MIYYFVVEVSRHSWSVGARGEPVLRERWSGVCDGSGMTWLTWLILALLVAAVAAITGIKPRGTRHVAHTQMLGVARTVLIIGALIVAFAVYYARP